MTQRPATRSLTSLLHRRQPPQGRLCLGKSNYRLVHNRTRTFQSLKQREPFGRRPLQVTQERFEDALLRLRFLQPARN
jgi:hypothetical protein